MRSTDLCEMLRKRYSPDAYALFFEVGNATGVNCRRHLDAVAMSLWPSRGLDLIGFEIKVSRQDWVRELKNPAKSSKHIEYLDQFYLVVATDKIVEPGELPSTWGLMVAGARGLEARQPAPRLGPTPISRGFLAALLKRQNELLPMEIEKARRDALAEQSEEVRKLREEVRLLKLRTDGSRGQMLEDFEKAAGIKLQPGDYSWNGSYSAKAAGKIVKMLLDGEAEARIDSLRRLSSDLLDISKRLSGAVHE